MRLAEGGATLFVAQRTGGEGNRLEMNGVIGEFGLRGWASVGDLETLSDLELDVDVSGDDLSRLGWVAGFSLVPATPFELTARIDERAGTYHLRHVALRTAGAELTATGTWNMKIPLRETDLTVAFRATDLSALLPAASRIPALQVR